MEDRATIVIAETLEKLIAGQSAVQKRAAALLLLVLNIESVRFAEQVDSAA